MRYVVLGDIHGNYYALEAVLEDIKNEYLKDLITEHFLSILTHKDGHMKRLR